MAVEKPDPAKIKMREFGETGNTDGIEQEIRKQIAAMPKTIRVGQQNKHILGTHEYDQYVIRQQAKGEYGPSRLLGEIEFAQYLVNKYSGRGNPVVKNGRWLYAEDIETDIILGIVVNNLNNKEQETNCIRIHYSKDGTHVVPHYLRKQG